MDLKGKINLKKILKIPKINYKNELKNKSHKRDRSQISIPLDRYIYFEANSFISPPNALIRRLLSLPSSINLNSSSCNILQIVLMLFRAL